MENIAPSDFTLYDLYEWLYEQSEFNSKFEEYTLNGSYINYWLDEDGRNIDAYLISYETDWGPLLESTTTQCDFYHQLSECSDSFLESTKVNDYEFTDEKSRIWKLKIKKVS